MAAFAFSGVIPTFACARGRAISTSSRPSSPSLVRLPCLQIQQRRCAVIAVSLRCRVASHNDISLNSARSSSLCSALEALEISAADRYTKERSTIVSIGLSVHSTPVEIREKLAIAETDWRQAVEELCNLNHIEEAAVLSTCNRLEIYVLALSQRCGVKEVTEWMSKTSGVAVSELIKHRILLYNKDAVERLFEVSSGLDSLVLGEGQILAQVKQVVKVGQGVGGFGRNMSGLFKRAISVGKRVRSETGIAAGSVSVSSAAVELALKKLAESSSHGAARMLVVGAGEMGKMVMKHLVAKGCRKMVVVNRSEQRVATIREEMKDDIVEIIYKPISELYDCAAAADVIFTCTASESPLYLKEHVENLAPVGGGDGGGLRLFIDISVPRNVGSCVASLETARVFNVDDLKEVVEANKEDRLRKVVKARAIIDEETKRFEDWRDSLQTAPTIKKLRGYVERIVMAELDKFCSRGDDHSKKDRKTAISDCARSLANKLLQGPMRHLRCDGSENRPLNETLENMHALNRMFDLEAEEITILK